MNTSALPAAWRRGAARACSGCPLEQRCFLAQPLPDEGGDCAAVVQRRFAVAKGEPLFRRDAPFSALFQVCQGAVKTQRVTTDGGLVISGFYLPGDVVGVDSIGDAGYPCDAVATTDAEVCKLDVERLLTLCLEKPGLHAWIISRIGLYVRYRDVHQSWSVGLNTHLRVLRFFLDLHDRLNDAAAPLGRVTALPMKKQDIARYLHVTPETLSRNLTRLRKDGLLLIGHDNFALPDLARVRAVTRL